MFWRDFWSYSYIQSALTSAKKSPNHCFGAAFEAIPIYSLAKVDETLDLRQIEAHSCSHRLSGALRCSHRLSEEIARKL